MLVDMQEENEVESEKESAVDESQGIDLMVSDDEQDEEEIHSEN